MIKDPIQASERVLPTSPSVCMPCMTFVPYLLVFARGDFLQKVRVSFALWAVHALLRKEWKDVFTRPMVYHLACIRFSGSHTAPTLSITPFIPVQYQALSTVMKS